MTTLPKNLINLVDDIVVAAMNQGHQPGVSIALTGPRGSYERSYGLADKRILRTKPLHPDHHVRIGSVTKSFTATAVFQQIKNGTLRFTDTLEQFVPGVPNGTKITIEHMLAMRSGVYDYGLAKPFQIMAALRPQFRFIHTKNILNAIRTHPSGFEPGSAYQYTNSNYILLGLVLEKITGRRIEEIISTDVLAPLGMTHTCWPDGAKIPAPAARGYSSRLVMPSLLKDQSKINPDLLGAAGGLVSTIGDLAKWAQYLKTDALLTPELHQMRTETFWGVDYPGEGPAKFGYGLGLVSFGTWIGHDGSVPGFSAVAMYDTDSGATFVGSENLQTNGLAVFSRIFERIADLVYPGSMEAPVYR